MTIYETKQICIKTNKGVLSIDPSDILYCTLIDGYSQIVLKSNEKIKTKLSLKKIEEKFKRFRFVRCHAKYLINFENRLAFDSKNRTIELINNEKLPVAKDRKANINRVLSTKSKI